MNIKKMYILDEQDRWHTCGLREVRNYTDTKDECRGFWDLQIDTYVWTDARDLPESLIRDYLQGLPYEEKKQLIMKFM